MGEDGAIATFAARKRGQKLEDSVPKINRQRQDRAELNHDRVHLPEAVVEIEAEHGFHDAKMSGRADRQKFGQSLNQSEQKGEKNVVHPAPLPST